MEILNKLEICEGKWTRIQGNKKSILDYVMVNKGDGNYLNKMVIDENKENTPFHIIKGKTVYSDHCAIYISMNWLLASSKERETKYKTVVNSRALREFKRRTECGRLTKIARSNLSIGEKYKTWNMDMKKIMRLCFVRKGKYRAKTRSIEKLYRKKRKLKIEYRKKEKTNEVVRLYKVQRQLINEYIEEEERKTIKDTIIKNVCEMRENGGINGSTFWEFKKRMERKTKKEEEVTALKDKDGILETDPDKIKEIFKEFYSDLFTPNMRENSEEEILAEEREKILFNSICEIAKKEQNSRKVISKTDIMRNIMKLKRKNTYDLQGWNTKMLHNCGEDAIKSMQIILDEIDKSKKFPNEWAELAIKSISKGGLNNNDVEKRRGLFITNVVNKVYEKIKMEQYDEEINRGISKYQCGGKKERSAVDHVMTLNAIIEYNKSIGSETYVLFADAYKCFDKLNLKNCIIDMYEDIGAEEAMKLYKLNENGKAIIKTPMGDIGPIDANEIVRQGTITGPKLCCKNTDKINKIGKKCITYIGPNIRTETLIYVDDIQNASSNVKQLKIAVDNLKTMEKQKGFIFNNDINKTGIMIINKKRNKDYSDIKVNVKRGEIKQTTEYKYLGEWYNEKGDNSLSLAKRKEKISYYIKEIKNMGIRIS